MYLVNDLVNINSKYIQYQGEKQFYLLISIILLYRFILQICQQLNLT